MSNRPSSKILGEVRPFEGNEAKANVEVLGELIGVRDVVADQFPARIPVTERDDSAIIANTDFAFLLNASKDALARRKRRGGIERAEGDIHTLFDLRIEPKGKVGIRRAI